MLNAPINVVFFAAFVTAFLKTRAWRLWDFTVFPLCVASLCVGTSMGFYDFFPVGGPLCVCEYFEILRFFSLCVGPLCLWTLKFYAFLPVCAAAVCGVFEILRLWDFTGLWDFAFFPCVWALCWRLWKFSKQNNMEKFRVWGFEMAVTQRKKRLAI